MLKKITALFLVIFNVLSLGISASAQEAEPSADLKLTKMLFSYFDADNIEEDETITRIEYLKVIVSAMDSGLSAQELKKNTFTDVKNDDDKKVLSLALILGLISENDNFNPNAKIGLLEAVKISICALGYKNAADYSGGWPAGYMDVADRLGIVKNVGSEMNCIDVERILYNTFNAPVLTPKKISNANGEVTYGSDDSKTFLSQYCNIFKGSGTVNANNNTRLTESKDNNDLVEIDYKEYEYKHTGDLLIGSLVDFYYLEDDDGSHKLICMTENRKCKEEIINPNEITGYANSYIDFTKDKKSKRCKLSQDIKVIYNGKACYDKTLTELIESSDKITLVSNDNADSYCVILIEKYEYILTSEVNVAGRFIKGSQGEKILDISDEKVTAEFSDGLDINQILVGNALCFTLSLDGMLYRIKQAESVNGYVQSVGENEIILSDKTYKPAFHLNREKFGAGMGGIFLINDFGEVAKYVQDNMDEFVRAWIIDVRDAENDNGEEVKLVKLFNEYGREESLNIYSKAVIDGSVKYDSVAYLKSNISEEGSFIRYKTNRKNEISVLDTASPQSDISEKKEYLFDNSDKNENDRLTCCYKGNYRFKAANSFAPAFHISDKTTLIIGIRKVNGDTVYSILPISYFLNNQNYDVYAYDVDGFGTADTIVCSLNETNLSFTSAVPSAIVLDSYETIDEDDNKVYGLYTYVNGAYERIITIPGISILKSDGKMIFKGDIVRYNKNIEGKICTLKCDFNSDTMEAEPGSKSEFSDEFGTIKYAYGSIYSIDSNGYSLVSTEKDMYGNYLYGYGYFKNYCLKCNNILLYSKKEKQLRKVSISDVKDYRTAGEGANTVLLRQYDFSTNFVVIYE